MMCPFPNASANCIQTRSPAVIVHRPGSGRLLKRFQAFPTAWILRHPFEQGQRPQTVGRESSLHGPCDGSVVFVRASGEKVEPAPSNGNFRAVSSVENIYLIQS